MNLPSRRGRAAAAATMARVTLEPSESAGRMAAAAAATIARMPRTLEPSELRGRAAAAATMARRRVTASEPSITNILQALTRT